MKEVLAYDHNSCRWRKALSDGNRTVTFLPDEASRGKTSARINIFGAIQNGDGDETGCAENRIVQAIRQAGAVDELLVYIDSTGGHCSAMANIMDAMLKSRAKKLITVCVGKAFSAACTIFLMGNERRMTPEAALMIHQANDGSGKTNDPVALAWTDAILDAISLRCDADRETIAQWMSQETYINPPHALRLGMATNLDFDAETRVGVDTRHAHQPLPVSAEERARQSVDELNRRYEQLQSDWKPTSRLNREIIEVPPMPAALRGHCIAGEADVVDYHRMLMEATASAGSGDFRAVWRREGLKVLLRNRPF